LEKKLFCNQQAASKYPLVYWNWRGHRQVKLWAVRVLGMLLASAILGLIAINA
jgi:hypothetical protein